MKLPSERFDIDIIKISSAESIKISDFSSSAARRVSSCSDRMLNFSPFFYDTTLLEEANNLFDA
jgi:hypothetical protein